MQKYAFCCCAELKFCNKTNIYLCCLRSKVKKTNEEESIFKIRHAFTHEILGINNEWLFVEVNKQTKTQCVS